MFDLGIQELVVIFVVALIVFGPKRLPELGKTLGKGILELRKAMEGVKEQISAESDTIMKEAEAGPAPEEKSPEEEKKDGETAAETSAAPSSLDDFYVKEEGTEGGSQGTENSARQEEPSVEKGKQGR